MPGTRQQVIEEVRGWIGTPYRSHARLKGVGVDCAQLPAAVYTATGLISPIDPKYHAQWMMHRDEEEYLAWVRGTGAREIDVAAAAPGDFLIWKWGRTFSHGGVLVTPVNVVHAQSPFGVTETNWHQDSELNNRPVKAFTVWVE